MGDRYYLSTTMHYPMHNTAHVVVCSFQLILLLSLAFRLSPALSNSNKSRKVSLVPAKSPAHCMSDPN